MNFFNDCKGIDEIKSRYRDLARKHHPDLGGCPETMKTINSQYEKELRGDYEKSGNSFTDIEELLKRDKEAAQALGEISGIPNITIEVCGTWIWVGGNTKDVKDKLKASNFRWASKKKNWYWRPSEEKTRSRKGSMTMDWIREKYGSKDLNKNRAYLSA